VAAGRHSCEIDGGRPWLLSLDTIKRWGEYLTRDPDYEGRHRHGSVAGWWDARRCLYTVGVDRGTAAEVLAYAWSDRHGIVHLSTIPPLPWVERDYAAAVYAVPQRFVIGEGDPIVEEWRAGDWWSECFPQHKGFSVSAKDASFPEDVSLRSYVVPE